MVSFLGEKSPKVLIKKNLATQKRRHLQKASLLLLLNYLIYQGLSCDKIQYFKPFYLIAVISGYVTFYSYIFKEQTFRS